MFALNIYAHIQHIQTLKTVSILIEFQFIFLFVIGCALMTQRCELML